SPIQYRGGATLGQLKNAGWGGGYSEPIQAGVRRQILESFKGLGLLVFSWHALDREARFQNGAFSIVQRKDKPRESCHSGPKMIIQQPGEPCYGFLALGRSQKRFVGVSFLIERQHIGNRRPQFDHRDGVVIAIASRQRLQTDGSGDPLQHRFAEAGIRADAIGDRGKSRAVVNADGCESGRWLATTADLCHPLPPSASIVRTPCSRKFGSFSS